MCQKPLVQQPPHKVSVEAVTRISFTSRESFLEINSCKEDLAEDIFVLAVMAHYAKHVVPHQPQKHGRPLASSVWDGSKYVVPYGFFCRILYFSIFYYFYRIFYFLPTYVHAHSLVFGNDLVNLN